MLIPKVKHNGKVAILYTPDYGSGWYSWHQDERLLFDPELVQMVEADEVKQVQQRLIQRKYPEIKEIHLIRLPYLQVAWIPEGKKFRIQEYDGQESILLLEEERYVVA
jgi:hypothetical protein